VGRLAEDGRIPTSIHYKNRTADYAERTELNVRDSEGTLILTVGPANWEARCIPSMRTAA